MLMPYAVMSVEDTLAHLPEVILQRLIQVLSCVTLMNSLIIYPL